ncbi:MAG: hypothetical protein M3N30_12930 [Bacteroidota bacterium]|jgi:hypothetical protein|nr:hypothetical protein [Bacteroidota bacterium]
MQTQKNIQFTNLIKAGGHLREFNFRKSMGIDGPLFSVDVADQKGGRHYIIFRLEDDRWILKTKSIPPWIEEVIPQIQHAIEGKNS